VTVTRWEQGTLPTANGRDVVDGWAGQVQAVAHLAGVIAGTPFVPASFRGSDTAVTAAILTGRELGIGPMTALQHMYVVNGRVGMSAQLMRALVFARGHSIRVVECDSERCTLVGIRRGEPDSPGITWTMADARRAGLVGKGPWREYPRAMLLARATGELCRAVFPDVIGGMAYTSEEVADMDAGAVETPAPAPTRTVRRTQGKASTSPPPQVEEPRPAAPSPHRPGGDPPPLPERQPPAPAGPQNATQTPELPEGGTQPTDAMSNDQRAKLMALLGEAERLTPRQVRLSVVGGLAGRRIESTSQLTRAEASRVIDTMVMAAESRDPAALDALVDAGWDAIHEREQPPLPLEGPPDELDTGH
jgi:hypothetical protein